MGISLHLLAKSAAINIFPNKGAHSRPPVIFLHKVFRIITARVASGGVIMVKAQDSRTKVRGDICAVLVEQYTVFYLPIGKSRAHRGGCKTGQGLMSGKNDRIIGGVSML